VKGSCSLFCFALRLSVSTSRGCVRPYNLDGATEGLFVRCPDTGLRIKITMKRHISLHQRANIHGVWLTQRFKTLQSPWFTSPQVQSNEVYPPPKEVADVTGLGGAADKRYSLAIQKIKPRENDK